MSRRYIPETHDSIVTEMNTKWRRTDQEIADEMGFCRDTITANRTRLGLPRCTRPNLPHHRQPKELPPPKEKTNPLKIASLWLGKRLVEKPSGFWLDGVPASLDSVMRAANKLMKEAGAEQVVYCERWRQ